MKSAFYRLESSINLQLEQAIVGRLSLQHIDIYQMSKESAFQSELRFKQDELKSSIRALKTVSIEIQDVLEDDKARVKGLARGYDKSRSLLASSFKALDGLLDESEVRMAIYVCGVLFLLFLLYWKLG